MTPSISSEPTLSAGDYLLFLRCPRSLHRRLAGRLAGDAEGIDSGTDDTAGFPLRSDRDEIRDLALDASGRSDSPGGVTLTAAPFLARVDIWRPQNPEGMAAVIAREGSGLKRDYLVEAAFIRYCAEGSGAPLVRLYVMYMDKSYTLDSELEKSALFVTADVTRRVAQIYDEHRQKLDRLREDLADDPVLGRYSELVCGRPHSCPVCSEDVEPLDPDHVLTLHRGTELAHELLAEGYTSIPEVPRERLTHPRQLIQQTAIASQRPHVDREALQEFLAGIQFPVYYLDFEAVNSAVPRYRGSHPWEHVPYLYSVHVEPSEGASPEHVWYLMPPGEDAREQLVKNLVDALGESGSVVVYSAAFETAILRRLGEWFPAWSESIESIIARVVDLLKPFSDFSFYHHAQQGKVRLKTVFPVLTSTDYGDLDVRDGYKANIGYRYLCEHPDDIELSRHLVEYCRMDTLAMMRIVRELRRLTR